MLLRIMKWTGIFVTIALAAWLIGLAINNEIWARDWSTIDDGWASLIGSAMGSFFAVVGALYVTKATERRKKKEFEDFVRVAVQNIVVQASYLEAMTRDAHKLAPTPNIQASISSIQLRNLTDALSVYEKEISGSQDGSYLLRREIVSTDAAFNESRPYLNIELEPTQALHNWHIGAFQIRHHASTLLENFGWVITIPTTKLIGEHFNRSIEVWRSWNTTAQTNQPPITSNGTHNQPLHPAHA